MVTLAANDDLFEAVGLFLAQRRPAILRAWRLASEADPEQRTARALTRNQFHDHIPEVLDAFQQNLIARPGSATAQTAERDKQDEEVKHGLHRWQQGYRLRELIHEWGHLQVSLFDELAAFALAHPEVNQALLWEVNREMMSLVNEAITQSAVQYERMQQAEATGHLGALQTALTRVEEIDRARGVLLHQAVHDLSSNVFGVRLAADALSEAELDQARRQEFAGLLQEGVTAVTAMLTELMELARLEAGQEKRVVAGFDAALLVATLCKINQPLARLRGLRLTAKGPALLRVKSDAGKVRRLLQNLVGNALKYTQHGGVSVSWGQEKEHWWLRVSDTGPGMMAGPSTPMLIGLKEATASARETDEKNAAATGEASRVLTPPRGASQKLSAPPMQQPPGEGVGLSIVKRLCELLDASLEVASSAETGTTFRVVLPLQYTADTRRVRPRKRAPRR